MPSFALFQPPLQEPVIKITVVLYHEVIKYSGWSTTFMLLESSTPSSFVPKTSNGAPCLLANLSKSPPSTSHCAPSTKGAPPSNALLARPKDSTSPCSSDELLSFWCISYCIYIYIYIQIYVYIILNSLMWNINIYTRIYTVIYFTNFKHGIVQSCNFHGKRHS